MCHVLLAFRPALYTFAYIIARTFCTASSGACSTFFRQVQWRINSGTICSSQKWPNKCDWKWQCCNMNDSKRCSTINKLFMLALINKRAAVRAGPLITALIYSNWLRNLWQDLPMPPAPNPCLILNGNVYCFPRRRRPPWPQTNQLKCIEMSFGWFSPDIIVIIIIIVLL